MTRKSPTGSRASTSGTLPKSSGRTRNRSAALWNRASRTGGGTTTWSATTILRKFLDISYNILEFTILRFFIQMYLSLALIALLLPTGSLWRYSHVCDPRQPSCTQHALLHHYRFTRFADIVVQRRNDGCTPRHTSLVSTTVDWSLLMRAVIAHHLPLNHNAVASCWRLFSDEAIRAGPVITVGNQ